MHFYKCIFTNAFSKMHFSFEKCISLKKMRELEVTFPATSPKSAARSRVCRSLQQGRTIDNYAVDAQQRPDR